MTKNLDFKIFVMSRTVLYNRENIQETDYHYFYYNCRCNYKSESGTIHFYYLDDYRILSAIEWDNDKLKLSKKETILLYENSEQYMQLTEENRKFFHPLFKWFDYKYIPKNNGWKKENVDEWNTTINDGGIEYEILVIIKNNQIDSVQLGIDTETFNSYFEFGDLLKQNVYSVIHAWEKEIYEINSK